ncbi:flagellar brake domain-containing protein [Fictibacillus sp. Mic-4]|uniref:flagellar brake protein n=1 Tax=Fictibacillus sp. Mic-4 TaxID=3132826 RepID=UPI003CED95D8
MITIGETVYLEPLHSEKQDRYKCKIVEIKENQLWVDYPINEKTKRTEFFLEGTPFKATFVNKKDQSVFMFKTELQGRKMDKIPVLLISYPGSEALQRIQRRQYVRVDTMLDVAVSHNEQLFSPFVTVAVDISAGGMQLVLPRRHSLLENNIIQCLIVLPMTSGEKVYLDLECNVLRISADSEKVRASIQFKEIQEFERQQIIRYCFEQQLLHKKKEAMNE